MSRRRPRELTRRGKRLATANNPDYPYKVEILEKTGLGGSARQSADSPLCGSMPHYRGLPSRKNFRTSTTLSRSRTWISEMADFCYFDPAYYPERSAFLRIAIWPPW